MWTKPEEKEFLISNLKSDFDMFEYGSGYSTLELPKHVKNYYSVEHTKEWFDKVVEKVDDNVDLSYVCNNHPWKSRDGDFTEFEDYIKHSDNFGPYDIVFIDGRARVECSRFIVDASLLKPDGFIFIHDFGPEMIQADGTSREHYNVVLNWLEVVENVETMYKFRIKR